MSAATKTTQRPRKESQKAGGERNTITLRLARSGICTPKDQKATIRGLGFRRLGEKVVREDTPAVRGMIRKVRHLLEVTKG
jgi:large subunit ribosomal protein L30